MIPRIFPPIILLSVLLAACSGGSSSTRSTASLGAKSLSAIKPPAFVPGPLDGKSTARDLALRRPLAVILDNLPDSRPQAGLSKASTVIETLSEFGITRFMALYLEHDATKVGPVRSTRMYFDHWAASFHSILAHVGGNDDAQALLWHLPTVFNVGEDRWEGPPPNYIPRTLLYWRSSDRVIPHNMYTSTYKLRDYARKQGQNWVYTQASFPHKQDVAMPHRGRSGSISIGFADPLASARGTGAFDPVYAVKYVYDRRTNTYLRFMGGAPHVDANTRRPLSPSNVVVMQTQNAVPDARAGDTPGSILIPTLGAGVAWYFRDGMVAKGTWQQRDQNAPLRFLDVRGRQVALNPGQTWVEVVPASSRVGWHFR